jgi:hypothetical protein
LPKDIAWARVREIAMKYPFVILLFVFITVSLMIMMLARFALSELKVSALRRQEGKATAGPKKQVLIERRRNP